MTVRCYADADLEAVTSVFTASVHALTRADYNEEQRNAWAPRPPDLRAWRKRLGALQTVVAVEGAEVAGFMSYEQNGHLDFLYVSPQWARMGVTSLLYGHVERALVSAGVSELFTEASLVARPFFARFGFLVTEKQNASLNGSSFQRYAMRKPLVAAQLDAPAARLSAGARAQRST